MNDNLKFLRDEKKQKGDAQEAEMNVREMAEDNIEEAELAETQKPKKENPSE